MASVSDIGKLGYIYDETSDTWYPLAGMTDPSQDVTWTGNHVYSDASSVTMNGTFISRDGINVFANAADRNTKIPSPINGTIAVVPVDGVMQIQYYNNGSWRLSTSNAFFQEKTSSYTITQTDAGTTLKINSSSNVNVTIPTDSTTNFPIGSQIAIVRFGTGEVSIVAGTSEATTVNVLSKRSQNRLAERYSQAIVVKESANTWLAIGDLKV